MLTRPIPDSARAVVEILRRDVPRPADLPDLIKIEISTLLNRAQRLRWREHGAVLHKCPMGLHPNAEVSAPYFARQFLGQGVYSMEMCNAVYEFGAFWDEQTDPQAAVDAVWGECP